MKQLNLLIRKPGCDQARRKLKKKLEMKKKTILFASLLLGGFSLMGTLPAAAAVRDTISINCGWQFHR